MSDERPRLRSWLERVDALRDGPERYPDVETGAKSAKTSETGDFPPGRVFAPEGRDNRAITAREPPVPTGPSEPAGRCVFRPEPLLAGDTIARIEHRRAMDAIVMSWGTQPGATVDQSSLIDADAKDEARGPYYR
jgi:hypothetical protein